MKMYITGGAKCGKSTLAQDTAVRLSERAGVSRYYIATMQPADAEDEDRVRRHVEDREGLDFITIEQPSRIRALCDSASFDRGGVYLIDSVTALLANEMFGGTAPDLQAGERVAEDLLYFLKQTAHVILVSDGIFSDAACFEVLTEQYREALARIDLSVSAACDVVAECVYGQICYLKGGETLPASYGKEKGEDDRMEQGEKGIGTFVFGGAFQGKRAYVREAFGIREEDFFECTEESLQIPEDARCVTHAERYVLACVRQGVQPESSAFFSCGRRIVICDDISAGIVPVDPVLRKWREETGILMRKLSAEADEVIRVAAGIPLKLKGSAEEKEES